MGQRPQLARAPQHAPGGGVGLSWAHCPIAPLPHCRIDRAASIRRLGRSDRGWTLIELLVVLVLIMIIATMAMSQYRNSVQLAREAALKSDLFLMRDAIDQYYADKGKYPESLQALVSESYLRGVPTDPMTRSADTWTTVPADFQPGSLSTSPGIYDVKSGSDGVAIDGSRYADW
jgi:general secretion pathway protein G